MVQDPYQNCDGKVPKNEWVQVDPLLCTNGSEKYIMHLSVKILVHWTVHELMIKMCKILFKR